MEYIEYSNSDRSVYGVGQGGILGAFFLAYIVAGDLKNVLQEVWLNKCLYFDIAGDMVEQMFIFFILQEAWLKTYIDYNTRKRQEARSEFQKSFHKVSYLAHYR